MVSSSVSSSDASGLSGSPVYFPDPYSSEWHIARKGVHPDVQRFLCCQIIHGAFRLCIAIFIGLLQRTLGVRGGSIGKGEVRLNSVQPARKWTFLLLAARKR